MNGTLVKDIMDHTVYTCHDKQTLKEVVEILYEKQIGGLTVIDGQQHVIGFISDGDIMRAVAKQKTRTVFGGVDSAMVVYDTQSFADKVRALQKRGVMELASKKVFCVSPEQPVDEVARILAKQKLKKVPVVDKDGVLVGVVRRSTIMRYILNCLFAK